MTILPIITPSHRSQKIPGPVCLTLGCAAAEEEVEEDWESSPGREMEGMVEEDEGSSSWSSGKEKVGTLITGMLFALVSDDSTFIGSTSVTENPGAGDSVLGGTAPTLSAGSSSSPFGKFKIGTGIGAAIVIDGVGVDGAGEGTILPPLTSLICSKCCTGLGVLALILIFSISLVIAPSSTL